MRLRDSRKQAPAFRLSTFAVVVVASTAIALVALARPRLEETVTDADRRRALSDLGTIAQALSQYVQDTGLQPTGSSGARVYGWLRGPGGEPHFASFPPGESGRLSWFLSKPTMAGDASWAGPYLDEIPVDPWGNPYVVFLGREVGGVRRAGIPGERGRIWLLSGGPDGRIDTAYRAVTPAGDDVALLLE